LNEKYDPKITDVRLRKILGAPIFQKEKSLDSGVAGVVTGLAWTPVGGDILFIETSLSKGKGKLTLTGNLGEVMKESASIALAYLKAHGDTLGLRPEVFDHWDIHIHVPEGATPKDGPSAGITMLTSLASAFTQRKIRKKLAMTGEITLRGKVLPVGGIKEKILAAKRAGVNDIVLSSDNFKDIEEIPTMYLKGLKFHYVDEMIEVLNYALLSEKVKNAVKIDVPSIPSSSQNSDSTSSKIAAKGIKK
jgi:ATP-dependent Lon protease